MRLIFLSVLLSVLISAQIDIPFVKVSFGSARNFQRFITNDLMNCYFEAEVGGKFVESDFEWGIHLGYWADNDFEIDIIDLRSFKKYKVTQLGLIFSYNTPSNMWINSKYHNFTIKAGLNTYNRNIEEIDVEYRKTIDKYTDLLIMPFFGVGINFPVNRKITLSIDTGVSLPCEKYIDPTYRFTMGVKYFFNWDS